jgi:hypothetical protein
MLGCRKPGQWSEQVDQSKLLYISYKSLVKALPRAVLAAYSCLLAHDGGGGKKGDKVVAAAEDPQTVLARGGANRLTGLRITLSLNK